MNEEPGWLRNDTAAHAREAERDGDITKATRRGADREADPRVAAEASRALAAGHPEKLRPGAVLHLQRAAGNAGVARLLGEDREPESAVKGVVGHGAGTPLDGASRERMEASFGADFSDVRVHTGGSAAESARAVNAHAYTVGNEIVLGEGQAPGSPAHERTLAHELAHVVQQRSGPVDGAPAAGGISLSDPADRFERAAETTADAVVGTGRAPDGTAAGAGASIQREEVPEEEVPEEEVQALAIQREEVPEEEVPEEEEEEEEVQALAIQRANREEEVPEETAPGQVGQASEAQAAQEAADESQAAAEETAPAAQTVPGSDLEEEQEEVQMLAIQREDDSGDERLNR